MNLEDAGKNGKPSIISKSSKNNDSYSPSSPWRIKIWVPNYSEGSPNFME